jgi:hypothetical protein
MGYKKIIKVNKILQRFENECEARESIDRKDPFKEFADAFIVPDKKCHFPLKEARILFKKSLVFLYPSVAYSMLPPSCGGATPQPRSEPINKGVSDF